uniref:Uncharacterized protein n=1 Tax=Arundo donax TaxID=35708 RepID=A0A0A9B8E3_ARUDO
MMIGESKQSECTKKHVTCQAYDYNSKETDLND